MELACPGVRSNPAAVARHGCHALLPPNRTGMRYGSLVHDRSPARDWRGLMAHGLLHRGSLVSHRCGLCGRAHPRLLRIGNRVVRRRRGTHGHGSRRLWIHELTMRRGRPGAPRGRGRRHWGRCLRVSSPTRLHAYSARRSRSRSRLGCRRNRSTTGMERIRRGGTDCSATDGLPVRGSPASAGIEMRARRRGAAWRTRYGARGRA